MDRPKMGTLEVAAEQATARGTKGVVLAAAPLAAALGAETMRTGGNAFDAVVTAALVETVMLPSKCGLAGDVVAIALQPGDAEPSALLAIGEAAAGLAAAARARGLQITGPLSVGVPGAPAGYTALAERGRLPLDRLVAPAIGVARDGFVWPRINHSLAVESRDRVLANNPEPNRFFPGGEAIHPHSVVRLPGLARVLEQFATLGAALFTSALGEEVAKYVAARGGILTVEDFERVKPEWVAPVSIRVGDRLIWATPAPTHGPALLEALSGQITGSAGSVWDRVQGAQGGRAGLHDPSGTSIVSAADAEGNVAVVIHSNSFPQYGSGLVVPEYDLILSNRPGRGFSSDPDHPNFPAPGRRPATTLHAWGVSDATDRPEILGGTPGGENQMPWNSQLLAQMLDGETELGRLVVTPRWELASDGGVVIEDGLDPDAVRELAERATRVDEVPRWGLRSAYQVIGVPRAGGPIVGAVDPRTGGAGVPV